MIQFSINSTFVVLFFFKQKKENVGYYRNRSLGLICIGLYGCLGDAMSDNKRMQQWLERKVEGERLNPKSNSINSRNVNRLYMSLRRRTMLDFGGDSLHILLIRLCLVLFSCLPAFIP